MVLVSLPVAASPALRVRGCAALFLGSEHDHAGRPLAGVLGLSPTSIQMFCARGSRTQIPMHHPSANLSEVSVAVGDSLVGYLKGGESTKFGSADLLVIETVAGRFRKQIPHAFQFCWNPVKPAIAVIRAHTPPDAEPDIEDLLIWNAVTGKERRFAVRPYQVSWLGPNRLIFDDGGSVRELNTNTGEMSLSRHKGACVSPDERYSLRIDFEGDQMIWDASAQRDITAEVLSVAGATLLTMDLNKRPFWLRGRGQSHLLVVPNTGGRREDAEASGYLVRVIDVQDLKVVRSFPGKFLAATSDGQGALINIGEEVRSVLLFP